jgi:hypothetical protein
VDAVTVRRALRETLEQQIALGDPPETRATFERLMRTGVTQDEAWRLLSLVLLDELNEVMRQQRPFDRARYISALNALADTPEQRAGA